MFQKTAPVEQNLDKFDTSSLELEPLDDELVFVPVDHRQRDDFDWSDMYARH